MKTPTALKLTISIREMERLITEMKENQKSEPAMSDQVVLCLVDDSDYNSLRIDTSLLGEQLSSYSECDSCSVSFK